MIVSHRHRFIFLKTHKTAGTSLEIGLSGVCGTEDVITPFAGSSADEFLRRRLSRRGPQNSELPLRDYRLGDWLRLVYHRKRSPSPFWNHMPARRVRRCIGEAVWSSYFKFCFERNPWDKAVSTYFFRTRGLANPPSFSEFVRGGGAYQYSDFDLYTIHGVLAVDQVFQFEDMGQALKDIQDRLGLPEPLRLPHAKGQFRKHHGPYQELYGAPERETIARTFAREIAHFGYIF